MSLGTIVHKIGYIAVARIGWYAIPLLFLGGGGSCGCPFYTFDAADGPPVFGSGGVRLVKI